MSDERKNEFADIEQSHFGIFGSDAAGLQPTLKDHDAVRAQIQRDGLMLTFNCDGCGAETHLLVEWPELVAMKYGLDPAAVFQNRPGIISGHAMSWIYDEDDLAWKPQGRCRAKCREFHFGVRLPPDDPERFLKMGRRARFINPAGEQQVSALCSKLVQGAPR